MQDFSLYGDGEILLSRNGQHLPFIGFFNVLSGIEAISYKKSRIPLGNGFSNINFAEYEMGRSMAVKRNTPVRTLTVCMSPDVFEGLTGRCCKELVEALNTLDARAEGVGKTPGFKHIDFAHRLCTSQAIASFTGSPADRLFLEAKALELVALQLKQLNHLLGQAPQKEQRASNLERISYACGILKQEMAHPPGARELASRVGLNHNQLVKVFKATLGVCPFEYLRTLRLETAYHMIGNQECNITEAAFSVGYSSLSHFSKSFRKEFGVTPKTHAQASKSSQNHL